MSGNRVVVAISTQSMTVYGDTGALILFPVSTAIAGTGSEEGSGKTPLGRFKIAEKIGAGEPAGTIYKSRIPAGIWFPDDPHIQDDLITSRILWLEGMEKENANTRKRYIYIHGTNHEDRLGTPASCGCIRMSNQDVMSLFDLLDKGDLVEIHE